MPVIDNTLMEEYPYKGSFWTTESTEGQSLLEEEDVEALVLEVDCDVQQASLLGNDGFKTTSYNVFFLMPENDEWESVQDRYGPIAVKRGMSFKCDCHGYQVDGIVEGVGFSQLGGCVVQIKDRTE